MSRSIRASASRGSTRYGSVARDYAWAIDVEICVFPQEGLLNDPGTDELLIEACEQGADVDRRLSLRRHATHRAHRADIRDRPPLRSRHRFPSRLRSRCELDACPGGLPASARSRSMRDASRSVTSRSCPRCQGRSSIEVAREIAETRRCRHRAARDRSVPDGPRATTTTYRAAIARADILMQHGVTCSLATNNVLNAFTPFGDCSLCRIANLYANAAQLGRREDLAQCMKMISSGAAKLMNRADHTIAPGNPANLIVLAAPDAASAIAEIVTPRLGIKVGRVCFTRAASRLHRPMAG